MSKHERKKPGALAISNWLFIKDEYVDNLVKSNIKNTKAVVVGSKALNKQVGGLYAKPTDDIDIVTKNALKQAKKLENQIDNRYRSDMVDIHPAEHPGTFRILSNYGVKDVADFTIPTRKIKSVKIKGVKYQSLNDIIKDREKILRDPQSKYRHDKDRMTIAKIKAYQKSIKKRM